jgi:uncharacterized iron-regulated protein
MFLAFVIAAILTGCSSLPGHYEATAMQSTMSFDEILPSIEDKEVIFVGEGHNREEDHVVQLAVIRHLQESGKRVAIALEMFPAEMQPMLNKWVDGTLSERQFRDIYSRSWNEPYGYYSGIFEYARNNRIPLVGINADPGIIEDVARSGPRRLSSEYRKAASFTSCEKVPEYARLMRLFESGTGHAVQMPYFCDAQLLRDTLMAYHIAEIFQRGNFTVVALVGSAHALKAAVPRILLQYHGMRSAVLMSRKFTNLISGIPDPEAADFIWY